MLILAAAADPTAMERLRGIPLEFWWKLAAGIAVLVAVVIVLRKLAKMNKLLLIGITLLVVSFIGFSWIYERNEPAWATPVVAKLAEFFPSKGRLERR